MKFLPIENIVYKTHLKPEEVLTRIKEVIEPKKTFRMTGIFASKDHKPYEGSIKGQTFDIRRIIGYRNSFIPIIQGIVAQDRQGTKITVKMQLHKLVFGFIVVWLIMVSTIGVGFIGATGPDGKISFLNFIPVLMLVFVYAMTMGGFKYESIKSKKYLMELFEAEMED